MQIGMSYQQALKQKSSNCFKIHACLISKYSNKFAFFMAKPINEIVYNENRSISNIQAKDLFSFTDQSEFLNRVYYYKSSLGKQQIFDRIRLIGSFYTTQRTYELAYYPTMIITRTAKVFKTRQRRLRKMIASDGSSDQSEQPSQGNQTFPSKGFLQSVSSFNSQSSLASMFKSVRNQLIFEQELHNIYESTPQIYQVQSSKNIFDIKDVNHLICDFDEVDVQKTLRDYQKITKGRMSLQTKNSLNSLSKKPVFQSIIINQKSPSEYKSTDKYRRLLSDRNEAVTLKSQRQYDHLKINLEHQNPSLHQAHTSRDKIYQNYYRSKKEGQRIGDIADRDWRRQKIRDKAAQLLVRVKSQNYLNGRVDYIKY